jgi:hypothetical protein
MTPIAAVSESEWSADHCTSTPGWFCRFCPTWATSATTGIPCRRSSSAGPIPDSMSNFGEPKAPAHRMTSRRALIRVTPGPSATSIPTAVPWSITMRVAWVLLRTCRFDRRTAGRT